MSILRITYNLKDEDDRYSLKMAQEGEAKASIIWDLDQWLREQIKYCEAEELQCVRDKLSELCENEGISIYD